MSADNNRADFTALTTKVVSSYVAHNSLPATDLPSLIESVDDAMRRTARGQAEDSKKELTPAVSIRKSVTPDYVICLEDGKRFKSLRQHLMRVYGLTPEAYRAKWNLPDSYPIVAPNYSARRSEIARQLGLGAKARSAAPSASEQHAGDEQRQEESEIS